MKKGEMRRLWALNNVWLIYILRGAIDDNDDVIGTINSALRPPMLACERRKEDKEWAVIVFHTIGSCSLMPGELRPNASLGQLNGYLQIHWLEMTLNKLGTWI